MVVVPDVKIVN